MDYVLGDVGECQEKNKQLPKYIQIYGSPTNTFSEGMAQYVTVLIGKRDADGNIVFGNEHTQEIQSIFMRSLKKYVLVSAEAGIK